MNLDRWIGSAAARIATVIFATGSAGAFVVASSPAVNWLGILLAIFAAMGGIVSSRRVYTAWMSFAGTLQTVVVTMLFGFLYLAIVPFFTLLLWRSDPLGLRAGSARAETYWRVRDTGETDPESYYRMG